MSKIEGEDLMGNKYFRAISAIVDSFIDTLEDGKLTRDEIWLLIVVVVDSVKDIYTEASDFDDFDKELIDQAVFDLYNKYIEPIELPGPDRIVDRILRDMVLPGLVDGILQLVDKQKGLENE